MPPSPEDLEPLFEELVRDDRIVRRIIQRVGTLNSSGEQEGWSLAETALHLVLVEETVADGFEEIWQRDDLPAPDPTVEESLKRTLVLLTLRIPRGAQAPDSVKPLAVLPTSELAARHERAFARLKDLIARIGPAPRKRLWLQHPALGPLSFHEWLKFVRIHADHHDRITDTD